MMTEAESIAYIKTLMQLERDGERTTIAIGPFAAFSLIGMLQLVTRHPEIGDGQLIIAHSIISDLATLFKGTPGEELVEAGNNPALDVLQEAPANCECSCAIRVPGTRQGGRDDLRQREGDHGQ